MGSDTPESVIAQWLASNMRMDDPGLVGPTERRNAHRIAEALRAAGWRILRATPNPKRDVAG
jgi:hypothetical protein